MTNYEKQATNFLKETKTILTIKMVGRDVPTMWKGETQPHNHYKFKLKNSKGVLEDDFWDSLYNTEMTTLSYWEYQKKHLIALPYEEWLDKAANAKKISAYDILSCLEKNDPGTFDEFCGEFGYDNDSISAFNIYRACQNQYRSLQKMFSEDELEELRNIQ